jgi:hypothetical protein
LQEARAKFVAQGINLVGVSYDNIGTLKEFTDRYHIEYPLLADEDSSVIKSFHMLNPDNTPDNRPSYAKSDMAYPGYFFVGKGGKVRETFVEDRYTDRFTPNGVIAKLFPAIVEREANPVKGFRLNLFLGQSDQNVVPGSRFSLIVDVVLPAGVHVYAPGVHGYKPIELTLNPSAVLEYRAASFPHPRILKLPILKEKVPVFDGRFRISQDVVVAGENPTLIEALGRGRDPNRTKSITIHGFLKYQACTERVCYQPSQVPVSWEFKLHQMDWGRASETNRQKEDEK